MKTPADETMPEVLYAMPHKGLYIASPHQTEGEDTHYTRTSTIPAQVPREVLVNAGETLALIQSGLHVRAIKAKALFNHETGQIYLLEEHVDQSIAQIN